MASPYKAVKKLYGELVKAGVEGLTLPAEEKVTRLIRPSTKVEPAYLMSERKVRLPFPMPTLPIPVRKPHSFMVAHA